MIDGEAESGHPLPASEEAREDLVPEHLARRKGSGADEPAPSQPQDDLAAPDGRHYPAAR